MTHLVTTRDRPIGCSCSPWHLGPCDWYIGWSPEVRKANLRGVACQCRLFFLPWVRAPVAPLKRSAQCASRGRAPLAAKRWDCQELRCGGCGQAFTAKTAPRDVQSRVQRVGRHMITVLRFGLSGPRTIPRPPAGGAGTPIPDAMQWDVLHGAAPCRSIRPTGSCFTWPLAPVLHNDDTNMPSLSTSAGRSCSNREELPCPERTGLFTAGIAAIIPKAALPVLHRQARGRDGARPHLCLQLRRGTASHSSIPHRIRRWSASALKKAQPGLTAAGTAGRAPHPRRSDVALALTGTAASFALVHLGGALRPPPLTDHHRLAV